MKGRWSGVFIFGDGLVPATISTACFPRPGPAPSRMLSQCAAPMTRVVVSLLTRFMRAVVGVPDHVGGACDFGSCR